MQSSKLLMRTKLTIHHDMFILARLDVRELLVTSKSAYYTNKSNARKGDHSATFDVVKISFK